MMRLIRLRGSLTLHELRHVTGYSRSAMNKHRDFLVECKLIKELPKKGDMRMVHLTYTERGKRKLEEIDDEIERQLMKGVGFTRRAELKAFAVKLEEALREFPENVTSGRWAYSVATDKKLAEEPVGQLLQPASSLVTPGEEPPFDQGSGISVESQFDPDWIPY